MHILMDDNAIPLVHEQWLDGIQSDKSGCPQECQVFLNSQIHKQ